MNPAPRTKALWLTEEETCNLLQLAVCSTANLGAAEEPILAKLGELYKAFLRESAGESAAPAPQPRRPGWRGTSSRVATRRRTHRTMPRALLATGA